MSMNLPEIEKQLRQLRQLVVRDQLSSNAYSLNSKGELEETLSGKLEAQGVDFQEGQGADENAASVRWLQDGLTRERLVGWHSPTAHGLEASAEAPGGEHAALTIIAADGGDDEETEILLSAGETGTPLFNAAGESGFLQLVDTPRKLHLNVGEATATWEENLGSVTINHRLGVEPIYADAVLIEGGEVFYGTNQIGITSADDTSFTFAWGADGVTIDAGTSLVRWVALG